MAKYAPCASIFAVLIVGVALTATMYYNSIALSAVATTAYNGHRARSIVVVKISFR